MSKEVKRYFTDCNRLRAGDQPRDECDVRVVLASDYDALLAERDALQAFANEIVSGAFEGGSFDGGDIQDIGVKHGLLRIEQRDDECGEACACREYGFPSECYRKTELLGFAALQGAQP
mgnify:CR=1 FL=1